MGNYNREYEKYYNKINNKHKPSPKQNVSGRNFSYDRKKNSTSLGKYMASDILLSSVISGCIFFSFFAARGIDNEFGTQLCEKFKSIVSTDGYYKEFSLDESVIVGAISKSFIEESDVESSGRKVDDSKNIDENKNTNKSNDSVESFNNFSVVEKTDLDFLKESKVIVFNGKLSSLEKSDLEGEKTYIKGVSGEVKSLLKGEIKKVEEKNEVYSVVVEQSDDLKILYHNLSKVNKVEGNLIEEGEVIGKSASNDELSGIVIQVLLNDEYINPAEHLDFLGANSSEAR